MRPLPQQAEMQRSPISPRGWMTFYRLNDNDLTQFAQKMRDCCDICARSRAHRRRRQKQGGGTFRRRRPAPLPPRPDYARIARLEWELGVGDAPTRELSPFEQGMKRAMERGL